MSRLIGASQLDGMSWTRGAARVAGIPGTLEKSGARKTSWRLKGAQMEAPEHC